MSPSREAAKQPETANPSDSAKPHETVARAPRIAPLQDVSVNSSPGGASARLDGNPANVCATPCILKAAAGMHVLVISMPGYQMERREFLVGNGPLELSPMILRAAMGTLMLTSDPKGASVMVNGKRIEMLTPAEISLAPGTYQIAIEKDGHYASADIEIHIGINYGKLTLGK
jgi:hypothetical protein